MQQVCISRQASSILAAMKTKPDYSQQLRTIGLKVTPLRLALLAYLSESELPIDVATCVEFLEAKKISFDQVTIYRNLESFVAAGVAKKVDLQGGKYYYEKASDCSHLICSSCGSIEHVHVEQSHQIAHAIVEKTGFHITQHVSDFFGVCKNCSNYNNAR